MKGYMSQFELDVERALETFLAEIAKAAERAAIEGIHAAFVRLSAQAPPPKRSTHRRASAQIDHAAVRDRVVARIRVQPGCNTTQLGRALGIHRSKLRLQLRKLADDGAIRIEERVSGSGGQRRRTYFVVEPAGARSHTEPSAVPAPPPNPSVEVMA